MKSETKIKQEEVESVEKEDADSDTTLAEPPPTRTPHTFAQAH
jgi:hypothetical protein